MDKTTQNKKDVIDRVEDSKNLFDQAIYNLSKEQEKSIDIGRTDLRNGKYHSNESVISEMKEKLNNFRYF